MTARSASSAFEPSRSEDDDEKGAEEKWESTFSPVTLVPSAGEEGRKLAPLGETGDGDAAEEDEDEAALVAAEANARACEDQVDDGAAATRATATRLEELLLAWTAQRELRATSLSEACTRRDAMMGCWTWMMGRLVFLLVRTGPDRGGDVNLVDERKRDRKSVV